MRHVTAALLLAVALSPVCAQTMVEDIAPSHIEGNVPATQDFERLLIRDLTAFFAARTGKVVRIEYRLLRDGPTQTGIAFPKYYAWVKVFDGNALIDDGAVRLAAIERKRFEITDFVSSDTARANRSAVEAVFPPPLVPGILASAGARI
jgi:hypothetical protein